jgi:hypothetical protein
VWANRMKQLLAGFFACALSACSTSGVPMAPQPSPHFDAVSSELQLGGTVYLYADIDGDAERASDFLLGVLRDSPELLTLSAPARLNATAMARVLGLDRARAVGLSSYESEGLFRNRGFIYADAREGLLRVLGGQPAKFDMVEIAPRSTDLVWRQDLDVGALLDVIRGLGALGVGLSPEALETALDQPFLTLDVTLRSVLEGLSPTIGVILDVDDTRNLWIPGESFTFPYADFIVSIEGLERVADAIIRYAASDPFVRAKRADGWTIVSPAIRLPPPWNAYEPSVIKEVATGRMYLVSSPSFLKECLATSAGVTTTAGAARDRERTPVPLAADDARDACSARPSGRGERSGSSDPSGSLSTPRGRRGVRLGAAQQTAGHPLHLEQRLVPQVHAAHARLRGGPSGSRGRRGLLARTRARPAVK